uniref:Uncharacterized protein n=1 Tax=Gracilinema caldarium TaxID=215591 RepID=A0A7C3DZ90_9SPIR
MIDIDPVLLTSFTLYSRLEQIALIPIWSLSSAVAAIAGQITPWMATATFFALPVFMITTIMSTAGFAGMSLAFTAYSIYFLNVPFCMLGAYVIGRTITSILGAIVPASLLILGSGMIAGILFFRSLESGRLKIRMSAVKE